MTATSPRAARRGSPLCGTARVPHPRLACVASPGRAVARMTGSPSASLRPPANRRPRSRRRGKGAKGGRKAASLAAPPGASGSTTPLPFPLLVTLPLFRLSLRTARANSANGGSGSAGSAPAETGACGRRRHSRTLPSPVHSVSTLIAPSIFPDGRALPAAIFAIAPWMTGRAEERS